jgi:hypothetical protein
MWQFPVFVRSKDSGDVKSYNSVEAMCRHFEQIDIENKEYDAWDATGLPLNLSVQRSSQWLRLVPASAVQPNQLAAAIAEFAVRQNVQVDGLRLFAGGFPAALAQITSAIQARRQTQSWWQRFKSHF